MNQESITDHANRHPYIAGIVLPKDILTGYIILRCFHAEMKRTLIFLFFKYIFLHKLAKISIGIYKNQNQSAFSEIAKQQVFFLHLSESDMALRTDRDWKKKSWRRDERGSGSSVCVEWMRRQKIGVKITKRRALETNWKMTWGTLVKTYQETEKLMDWVTNKTYALYKAESDNWTERQNK